VGTIKGGDLPAIPAILPGTELFCVLNGDTYRVTIEELIAAAGSAALVTYDGEDSGLDADNVQGAIDELADECVKTITVSVDANHTITTDDYAGANPATTRLVVLATAALTITFPADPVAGQVVEVIKSDSGGYLVTIETNGDRVQIWQSGGTSNTSFTLNSGSSAASSTIFGAAWRYTGERWLALSNPRQQASIQPDSLQVSARGVVCCTGINGVGEVLVIGEGEILRRLAGGGLSSGKVTGPLCDFSGLSTYADDTAAGVGGLTAGQLYKTAAGALMVKL